MLGPRQDAGILGYRTIDRILSIPLHDIWPVKPSPLHFFFQDFGFTRSDITVTLFTLE